MILGQIVAFFLIGCAGAATYLGITTLRAPYRMYSGNLILGVICFMSAIWDFGFGLLFMQSNPILAYWGRGIGMIGVMGLIIFVQLLISNIGNVPRWMKRLALVIATFGVPIYFLTVKPSAVEFIYERTGMTYIFKAGIENTVYTLYTVFIAINIGILITTMYNKARNHREVVTAKKFVVALSIMVLGMVMDTIFPMLGLRAIPGSSLVQFFCVLVLYYAVVDYNRTRLTQFNMFSYVYRSVAEPVLVFDKENKLALMNEAAIRMFPSAKDSSTPLGSYFDELFDIESNFLGTASDHQLTRCNTKENNTPVEIQVNIIRDKYQDELGYIITVKDMTEINHAMDSLLEAKKSAENASKAKSTFLANVSHEIRTPLNAIVGFSELLIAENLDSKSAEHIDDIRSSARNLLAIINDILDISKIESGRVELVEEKYRLSEVLKDTAMIASTLTEKKGLSLEVDFAENIPDVLVGDYVKVRGILVNVINNAVKYTPEGFVRVTGSVLSVKGDDLTLRFTVKDSGIGIKEEDIPKIFDSFSQVDQKVNRGIEGTGLGLAIVKAYVELMNGKIDIESKYGEGSEFIIIIHQKLYDKTSTIGHIGVGESTGKVVSNIHNVDFNGIRVLSVDDTKINLKLVERTLSKYGMIVTSSISGMDAIEKCRNNEYDVILMDQMMPEMDGIEAMNKIREISPYYAKNGKCLIIALTANAISGVRDELIGMGFDNYLSKPMNFSEIEQMFKDYIEAGTLNITK